MRKACVVLTVALIVSAVAASGVSAAPRPRLFVFIDPDLAVNGEKATQQIDAFLHRLEAVLGWKAGSLKGQGFVSSEAAEAFIKKAKPSFGLLSVYDFVRLRKTQSLLSLGHAGVWEPKRCAYKGITFARGSRVGALPHQQEGLRLATPITDMQWLNVIFDGLLHPATHFKFVPAISESEAVEAVREKRADLALVWAQHLDKWKDDLAPGSGSLKVAFSSAQLGPPALVFFEKNGAAKDARAMVKALPEVCKGKANVDVCADLGFFYLKEGPAEYHPHVAYKYENYK